MIARWALPPLLALALVACATESVRVTREATRPLPADKPALSLTLRSDRAEYFLGQPVQLELTLTNLGRIPISVSVPTSQLYDFAVLRDGREVWRWSAGRVFPMEVTEIVLAPGQTGSYKAAWDQRDAQGRSVVAGRYVAVGVWLGGQQVGLGPIQLPLTIR